MKVSLCECKRRRKSVKEEVEISNQLQFLETFDETINFIIVSLIVLTHVQRIHWSYKKGCPSKPAPTKSIRID